MRRMLPWNPIAVTWCWPQPLGQPLILMSAAPAVFGSPDHRQERRPDPGAAQLRTPGARRDVRDRRRGRDRPPRRRLNRRVVRLERQRAAAVLPDSGQGAVVLLQPAVPAEAPNQELEPVALLVPVVAEGREDA